MTTLSDSSQSLSPTQRALRTFLIFIVLFVVYAFTVQAINISLERPLNPERQEAFIRVLRLLANPDIFAFDEATGRLIFSDAMHITFERIIETIFMALMATTVGTALAVPVSFLAARNLMSPVTAPLAAIMAAVVALPIGGFIGHRLTQLLFTYSQQFTQNVFVGIGLALAALALAWLLLRAGPSLTNPRLSKRDQRIATLKLVPVILLGIFVIGIVAYLGLQAGDWLEDSLRGLRGDNWLGNLVGWFSFLGNFVFVLSDFIRLLLPAALGLLGAMLAASYGSRIGQETVLSVQGTPARLITAVLTALGTAVFIYGVGSALNWLYLFDNPANWTTRPAMIGAGVGLVIGLVVAPKRPFPIGFTIYSISRAIFNTLRSIEPLIMGIVFVVWVSLGPFAGIMALTLHTIAALGKLFSEQIEGIDDGPIEAINATGANRVQMIVYAVIPQIVPPYIAFTLYRWDINVRMSTIIGFVGGGGIGFVLSQNIQQLRYRQASVMMLAIAIVVSLLDYLSSRIRSRII